MSRSKPARAAAQTYLRSINICYDAESPERIAHFHPTTKSAALLRALLGEEPDHAFFVVAPYGSGKSLTATYLLHLVENRAASAATLRAIEPKLASVSPELGRFAANRRRPQGPKRHRGLVLALHAACPSLPRAI